MDNYENQNFSSENEHTEPQAEPVAEQQEAPRQDTTAYRGTGAGRKESPYANSPYVMNHQNGYQSGYQPRSSYQPQGSYESSGYRYQPENTAPQSEHRYQPHYEAPKKAKKKNRSGFWKKALAVVAALALVAGSCAITANLVNKQWEERMDEMAVDVSNQIQYLQQQIDAQSPASTGNSVSGTVNMAEGYSAGQVYAQNVQSVVLIQSTIVSSYYGQSATGTSAGSGFIISEDGYVITNYHVVEGATSVSFSLYDGSTYNAEVVGYDDTNDVAVLKADAAGLSPVTIGSSNDLIVGDQVVAIGNPLGELTSTLTVGYVSAKERDVSTDGTVINMLQTDCAINSGNSGGPLFNMKGEVVGITTAKYSGSSSSGASIEGIGFAIPIDDVTDVIDQLVEFGYIETGYMGVIVQDMDSQTASIYGLPVGAYVVQVEEDGGAYAAGIQAKDIITKVGDETIENITDLTRALRNYKPGDVAMVTIYRSGREIILPVELAERPADTDTIVEDYQNSQGSQGSQDSTMPEGDYEDWYNYFAPFFGYGGNGNNGG